MGKTIREAGRTHVLEPPSLSALIHRENRVANEPSLRLSELDEEPKVGAFLDVLDWVVQETRASS